MNLTNKVLKHFKPEVTEIYNRYLNGKKPNFFPYNKEANNIEDMVNLSLNQMFSVTTHLKTLDSWKHRKNQLTFEQWIIYQLITSSLKGTNKNDIIQRIINMDNKKEICEKCGETKTYFMHNCPISSDMPEIYGCPNCDDHCAFCIGE